MPNFTVALSEQILIRSESSKTVCKVHFDEPSENGIEVFLEATQDSRPLGRVTYQSFGGDWRLSFHSSPSVYMTFEVHRSGTDTIRATHETPHEKRELQFDADGKFSIDEKAFTKGYDSGQLKDLEPLLRSIMEVRRPMLDVVATADGSPVVVFSGKKTAEDCRADYKANMKDAAAVAIAGATASAGAALGGPLGIAIGLGGLIGTYFAVSSKEDKAKQQLKECLKDAGTPA